MADLPDYYTIAQISEAEAASVKGGLDINKSDTPVSRQIYFGTDTGILYVCIADGFWTGFDASILTQGILTLYENMAGGGKRITNIADPTAAQDAATRAYVLAQDALEVIARDAAILVETNNRVTDVDAEEDARIIAVTAEADARAAADALRLLLTGGTMSGPIAMGANKITGLADPTVAQDAATRAYVLAQKALCLLLTGGTMSGDIAMGNNIVSGMKAPTADGDAARKKYIDDILLTFLLLAGGTMAGNIAMAGHKVTGLGAPAAQDDALRYNRAEIRNAEIAVAAAIAYSKLNLTGAIKAADIEAAAGIPLTKLEDAVCSETEAANLISTHDGLAAPHSAAGFVKLTVAETQVFSGTSPTAWTDLNLSGVVGANVALVVLKIYNPYSGVLTFGFRADGETELATNNMDASPSISGIPGTDFGMVIVHTNALGVVEWIASSGQSTTTVDVVAYIK